MPYKDIERRREYQRERYKTERSARNTEKINLKLETADDLKPVLEAVINEVLNAKMDAAVRGRCIAQLVGTSIKLLEVGDIEARMSRLEQHLFKTNGNKT